MLLLSPVPTERFGELTRAIRLNAYPRGNLTVARPVQLARPSPLPGEHAWLDTAAGGGHKSQNAEISPAFNIKLTQGSALAPFSSTLTQRTDMGHTRGRCHETPLGISYRMKLSRAAGFTTLHNDTHLQPGILHYAKLPQHTKKYSLDYNSLESVSALSTQTYLYFRWDQLRLSCALMRSGRLKSEKMHFKKKKNC